MSRVGKQPIAIPSGVDVSVKGQTVTVKGGKSTLTQDFRSEVSVAVEDGINDIKQNRALHGLYRQLINNMIIGVTKGFEKTLEIVGVGWRGQLQGRKIVMQIGFCHPVELEVPAGLEAEMPNPTTIVVKGADKQAVGGSCVPQAGTVQGQGHSLQR